MQPNKKGETPPSAALPAGVFDEQSADFGALPEEAVFAFICLCNSCKRRIQPPSLSLRLNSYGIVPLTSFAELHVGSASLKSSTPCRIAGCGEIGSSRA